MDTLAYEKFQRGVNLRLSGDAHGAIETLADVEHPDAAVEIAEAFYMINQPFIAQSILEREYQRGNSKAAELLAQKVDKSRAKKILGCLEIYSRRGLSNFKGRGIVDYVSPNDVALTDSGVDNWRKQMLEIEQALR